MRSNLLKKGQLEIGITMMVLLVFFILLIVALVVYFQFTHTAIKENRQETLDNKFSTLVNSITGLPEIKCSVRGTEKECLDVKKLIAFGIVLNKDEIKNKRIRQKYLEDFGILGLKIDVVYPEISEDRDCISVPNALPDSCNKFILLENSNNEGLVYSTPVSLFYPEENLYKIGRLAITAKVE